MWGECLMVHGNHQQKFAAVKATCSFRLSALSWLKNKEADLGIKYDVNWNVLE